MPEFSRATAERVHQVRGSAWLGGRSGHGGGLAAEIAAFGLDAQPLLWCSASGRGSGAQELTATRPRRRPGVWVQKLAVPSFSPSLLHVQAMCAKVPDDPEHLAARRQWRDECLMRLDKLKRQMPPP